MMRRCAFETARLRATADMQSQHNPPPPQLTRCCRWFLLLPLLLLEPRRDNFVSSASSCNPLLNSDTIITVTDAPTYGVVAKVKGPFDTSKLMPTTDEHRMQQDGGKTVLMSDKGTPYGIYDSKDDSICGYAYTIYGMRNLRPRSMAIRSRSTDTSATQGCGLTRTTTSCPSAPRTPTSPVLVGPRAQVCWCTTCMTHPVGTPSSKSARHTM